MYSPSKRYRHAGAPTSVPYRGWKRWHTIIGLIFGVIATTWAFSGLLSMGPFDFVERLTGTGNRNSDAKAKGEAAKGQVNRSKGRGNRGGVNIASALQGDERFDLALFADKSAKDAIASVAGSFQAKELEFTMFAGEPVYLATDGKSATRIIPVDGEPKTEFNPPQDHGYCPGVAAGPNLAELRLMDEYDAYYLDRTGRRPLPVVYARMNDENQTRYYIDPGTGRVAGNYSSRNWVNRWLYHGLHSLDFPWLYKYRPLWDIVVISLMLGGTALCVTSLILTWRVLQRKIMAMLPLSFAKAQPEAAEDLARADV